jgi:hypothetical protein
MAVFSVKEIMDYEMKRRASVWAQMNTRLKGRPYTFQWLRPDGSFDFTKLQLQRKFLIEPLDDPHPWKSTQKARQLGLSENGVREVLWFADTHEFTKQVYVFPTDGQVKDFSRTRIEEVINDSPYLMTRMGIDPATKKRIDSAVDTVANVRLKKIGKSYIFFRSGATQKAGEGVDADCVYFDELDRMASNVTIAFNETLAASPFGWRRDISTPSLPGVGVNASFQISDQRHYFFKCPHCGEWITLILEYPRSVIPIPKAWFNKYHHLFVRDVDTHAYICTKCGLPISNEDRTKGVWYPLYKDKSRVRGYQLTQMIAPWISATKMMQKREDYKLEQLFVNYVLGLPFLGDNIMLTESDIMRCIDTSMDNPNKMSLRNVVVGGDWGNDSWQIAGMPHPDNRNQWIILDLHKINDGDLAGRSDGKRDNPHIKLSVEFFRKWRAILGVYDAGYGKDRNFELLQTFPGKIYSCFYPNNMTDYTKDFEPRWSTDYKVNVDRTMTLKLMVKKFINGEIIIPKWVAESHLFPTFIKHLTNLVSIKDIEEDKDGVEKIVERIGSLPGGDHYGHSMAYLYLGLSHIGNRPKSDFF